MWYPLYAALLEERKKDRQTETERSAAKCRQILIRRCPFSWHRRRLILCVQDKFEINARYTTYLQNSSQCLPIPHHRLICTESRKQQQWRARRDVTLQYCSARKHPATKVWSGWSNWMCPMSVGREKCIQIEWILYRPLIFIYLMCV